MLNIGENPAWAQLEGYTEKLQEFFSKQSELESINLSHNQTKVNKVWPIIEALK